MSDTCDDRAAQRRRDWKSGILHQGDDTLAADLAYWAEASGSDRLDAVLQMGVDSLILSGHDGPLPRLQGSASGIRRR
jgi:hypothetical protein